MNGDKSGIAVSDNENRSSPAPAANESGGRPAQYLAVGLAVGAGLLRIIPHPWNFTPVTALGLFGGARLRPWQAFTLPFVVMVVSDFLLWLIVGPAWKPFNLLVYGCFAVSVLLGLLLRRTRSPLRIGAASVAASLLFFLVTNFGVWYSSRVGPETLPGGAGMMRETEGSIYPIGRLRYADNANGLMTCYFMGLDFSTKDAPPLGFTGNLLAGDLFFTGLLFGAYGLAARRWKRPFAMPQAAKVPTAEAR
jgi:hypothetical protein